MMKSPLSFKLLVAPVLLASTLSVSACVDDELQGDPDPVIAESSYEILGGYAQQDYFHPWRVSMAGCNGVLIHPEWILTAAHCVDGSIPTMKVGSTDRKTGVANYRIAQLNSYASQAGRYLHPNYDRDAGFGTPRHDIALLRIKPQALDRYVQTAALPNQPLSDGTRALLVSNSNHGTDGPLDAGYVKTQTFTVDNTCATFSGARCISAPDASVCEGDSGSGVYRRVRAGSIRNRFARFGGPERTTVVGITSYTKDRHCDAPGTSGGIADVYYYKDWILQTIASSTGAGTPPANQQELEGNVIIRKSGPGAASPAQLRIRCIGRYGTEVNASAPMDVPGVALGLYCNHLVGAVKVSCGNHLGSLGSTRITGFTWKTGDGTTELGGGPDYTTASFSGGVAGESLFTCTTELEQLFFYPTFSYSL